MFSNLLDNAIVAAKKCEEYKKVKVFLYKENEGYFNILKIVNSYDGVILRKNGTFLTTKEDHELHGIGIESIKRTINKYGGYLECLVDENRFTAILVIPT